MTSLQNGRNVLLRASSLQKRYGSKTVVSINELEIYEGDCILLTGANGSGKSTLMRLIAGVTLPDMGKIWREPNLIGHLGYVPQHGGLYADLTLEQNLRLRCELLGQRIGESIYAAARDLALTEKLSDRYSSLSGGYQRLAVILAALCCDPSWILLDEPFGGMDPYNRELLSKKFQLVYNRRNLFIIALPEAEEIPGINRWLSMADGSLIENDHQNL